MAKINVRSPYYVSRTEISLTQVDMDLWIYTGEQVNDRNGQNGTLFRLTSFAVAEVATFEISEIIKDYIDNQFQVAEEQKFERSKRNDAVCLQLLHLLTAASSTAACSFFF